MATKRKSKTVNKRKPKSTAPVIQAKRLLRLADHLEHPEKLIHKNFDFRVVNNIGEETGDFITFVANFDNAKAAEDHTYGCGSSGCAIGECPAVFKEWKFTKSKEGGSAVIEPEIANVPTKLAGKRVRAFRSADKFFGLYPFESNHLFAGYSPTVEQLGGITLRGDASSYDVARQIRSFLERWKTKPWNRKELNVRYPQ